MICEFIYFLAMEWDTMKSNIMKLLFSKIIKNFKSMTVEYSTKYRGLESMKPNVLHRTHTHEASISWMEVQKRKTFCDV